jgi:hypothetical protein
MVHFLNRYYEETKDDGIGRLLSDLQTGLFADGGTADPAAWEDWERSVSRVLGE